MAMSRSSPLPPSDFGIDWLASLRTLGVVREYAAGTTIFSAGDIGDGFHVVEDGRVSIRGATGAEAGRELASIVPGDFFGEMAVLDEAVRSATAVAEEATRTRYLGRDEFLRLLHEHPEFALQLIRAFSTRLRAINRRYLDDILQSERLATVGRWARATVHDFKNPLAVISLAAEIAGQPGVSAEASARARDSILKQVAHMDSLLHELIDFTRSGRKELVSTPSPLAYAEFVHREVEGIQGELVGRPVVLRVHGEIPAVSVMADAKRLPRLFRNLIANAVDAMGSDGGTVSIRVFVDGGEVVTEVADSGPGIAAELAARLFEPFATFGKEHGTGLGLSICQRIAEDHGGRIWAANAPGGGALFSFTLPKM